MLLKEWHTPTLWKKGTAALRTLGGFNTTSVEAIGSALKRTA